MALKRKYVVCTVLCGHAHWYAGHDTDELPQLTDKLHDAELMTEPMAVMVLRTKFRDDPDAYCASVYTEVRNRV